MVLLLRFEFYVEIYVNLIIWLGNYKVVIFSVRLEDNFMVLFDFDNEF